MTGPQPTTCASCGVTSWGHFCGRCGRALTVGAPAQPPPPPDDSHAIARAVGIGLICVLAAVTAGLGYRVLTRDSPAETPAPAARGLAAGSPSQPPGEGAVSPTAPPGPGNQPTETDSPGTAQATLTTTTTGARTSTPTAGAAEDEQAQRDAYAALRAERQHSLDSLLRDGRWVLQLSSKYNGLTDPLQTAKNSSHTFYYTDILAEHTDIKGLLSERGWPSITLLASDFGRSQTATNKTMWVLLGDPGGMSGQAEAQSYCQALYPGRTGDYLKNVCLPRRLYPPPS